MKAIPIPESRQKLLVGDALYTFYELGEGKWSALVEKALEDGALDAYCPKCARPTVFRVEAGYLREALVKETASKSWFGVEARCTRDHDKFGSGLRCDGRLLVVFLHDDKYAHKVGLYPSKADLDFGSLDPLFADELDPSLRADLGRAIGLRAHGVGAGSFVYLRRIFEGLIDEAHSAARASNGWAEEIYQRSRMTERIELLRSYLPSRLVKSASLYAILSKGVHELDESECLKHFDLVFNAIEMILRQRHEEKAHNEVLAKLQKAHGELA